MRMEVSSYCLLGACERESACERKNSFFVLPATNSHSPSTKGARRVKGILTFHPGPQWLELLGLKKAVSSFQKK